MISARPALIALTTTAVALTGCGGSASKLLPHRPTKATITVTAHKPAGFTSQQVSEFFSTVTGDDLRTNPSTEFDSLAPSELDYTRSNKMDERYGSFSIFVLHSATANVIYDSDNGRRIAPDAQGIYWHGNEAMKPYKNVVLDWTSENGKVDQRFTALDSVLSKLGQPAAKVRAALPAGQRPCGGDATAGTCEDSTGATVTTVNRNQTLKLPSMSVRVSRVEHGRVVIPADEYGLVRRAKGEYVLVAVKIDNTGDDPLDDLYNAKLKVGDKVYTRDDEATWTVTPQDAFPIQPGDDAVAGLVFDLPRSAVADALKHGVIAFPADKDQYASLDDAMSVGQITLATPATVGNA